MIVSVIMPVYNGETYLKEAIDSILNQTLTDFEFIIINDGSTDKTEEIILSYTDTRIRYIKNETNLKIVKTLNIGIELAKGKYIARMDADDVSSIERLQMQYDFMQKNPYISICGTALRIYEKPETVYTPPVKDEEIKVKLIFESCLYHPTIMFKKNTILEQGGYNELFVDAEDLELWLRLSRVDSVFFANLATPLLLYRKHYDLPRRKYLENQKKTTKFIIKNQLEYLGINFNDKDFSYHEILTSPSSYEFISIGCLHKCKKWINQIEQANTKNNIYSSTFLKNELDKRWFILCFNAAAFHPLAAFHFLRINRLFISLNSFFCFIRILWRSRVWWNKYLFSFYKTS